MGKKNRLQAIKPTYSDPSREIFYMTYSPTCVALQKLTHEMGRFYEQIGMGFKFIPQHPPYGPYRISETDTNEIVLDQVPYLVLHRGATHGYAQQWTPQLQGMLRNRKIQGLKTVYFLDDFLMYMNSWYPVELMRRCDKIITLGYMLKHYLETTFAVKNIVQMKTHVDLTLYDSIEPIDEAYVNPNKFNILYFSMARTGLGFMKELFAALDKAPESKDIVFHIIAPWAAYVRAELYENRHVGAKYHDFVPYLMLISLTKACDLVINPVHIETDNQEFVPQVDRSHFMNAKSEVKYTHAGGAGIPLLSCKTLAYNTCIEYGTNGFISDDVDEWIDIILDLKKDDDNRKKIGETARKDVEKNYDAGPRFTEYLEQIIGG